MTRVLVSDTSIIIDLERGDLLSEAFAMPYEFVVPDLLYQRELADDVGARLVKLGLTIAELSGDQVAIAQRFVRVQRKISLPDAFALALAKTHSCVLLTGDQILRELAGVEGVICHGMLWVLDQMLDHSSASAERLFHSLTRIAAHPRCRLPKNEVGIRRKAWAAVAGIALEE